MSNQIVSKKTIDSLSKKLNENVGSSISQFARKQMEKMGWTEGKGLGKLEDGISKHIVVDMKQDTIGIISKEEKKLEINANEEQTEWWKDAFKNNSKKFKKKKDKKDKKDKKSKKDKRDKEDSSSLYPSYDELFKATGGARLGMRARMKQVGKIKRTENINIIANSDNSSNEQKHKKSRHN